MDVNEVDRHQAFRQFLKEIRGSRQYLIVGIDVAKDRHYAFFGDARGRTLLKRFLFDNTEQGFADFIDKAEEIRVRNGLTKVVFGMEPTANYHKPLGHHLISEGLLVVLVSGVAIKRNRELLDGRWDKHDLKDAANAADLVAQGKCVFYENPPDEINQLRELISLRKATCKGIHAFRMRLRGNIIAKYFPEFDPFFGRSERESMAIVRWFIDPAKLSRLDFNEFVAKVTTTRVGLAQQQRLHAIWKAAAISVGCPITEAGLLQARLLVDQLEEARARLKEIEAQIADICRDIVHYQYLLTIPGFGPHVSSVVLAIIGDPHRFANRKQVIKMAGLDLNACRSGKTNDKGGFVITKKGNPDLRYALYQAGRIACIFDPRFRAYFKGLLKGREREKGIKTKMYVKLAAKMLVIAWTLMKKNTAFDPSYLGGAE